MPLKEPSLSLVLLGLTMLAVLGGSITVWGVIFSRLSKREPVVPYEPRRPLPRGGIDVLMAVLLGLIVLMIGLLVAHTLASAEHSTPAVSPAAPPPSEAAKQLSQSDATRPASTGENVNHKRVAGERDIGPNELIQSMCLELIVVVLLVAAARALAGAKWHDLGFNFSRLGHDLGLGVCAYLAAIVPLMAMQWALAFAFQQPYTHPIIEGYKHQPDAWMLSLTALSAIVVAPFCEEFLFRVLLQGWFESIDATWQRRRRKEDVRELPLPEPATAEPAPLPVASGNPYARRRQAPPLVAVVVPDAADTFVPKPAVWPILLSSVLFALSHFGQGLAPVTLFFLALLLGYLYQRTHRIWPSLVVHLLLNAGSIVILWLYVGNNLPIAK